MSGPEQFPRVGGIPEHIAHGRAIAQHRAEIEGIALLPRRNWFDRRQAKPTSKKAATAAAAASPNAARQPKAPAIAPVIRNDPEVPSEKLAV